jgi:hypothetical protein
MSIDFELQLFPEWTERQKLSAAVRLLGGHALEWFLENNDAATRHIEGYVEISSWFGLQRGLQEQFQPPQQQVTLRRQLDQLRQGLSSVHEYAGRFREIVGQLPDMAESDRVHRFISGLRNNAARDDIAVRGINNLLEAVRIASLFELVNKPYPPETVQQQQHQDAPIPMELDGMEKGRFNRHKSILCHNCGEANHIARYCMANGRHINDRQSYQGNRNYQSKDGNKQHRQHQHRRNLPRQYRTIGEDLPGEVQDRIQGNEETQ